MQKSGVPTARSAIAKKVRPYQPFEEFSQVGSEEPFDFNSGAHTSWGSKASRRRIQRLRAAALNWYAYGKFWVDIQDKDISLEELLLDALKLVSDADLRRRIEETLIERQRSKNKKSQEKKMPPDVKLKNSV